MNSNALSTNRFAVEVVEATRLALVPQVGALEGQCTVTAETEAIRVKGTCLNWPVKLESVEMLAIVKSLNVNLH